MLNPNATLPTLYKLFFHKDLVELSKNLPISPVKSNRPIIDPLTPMSKMILSTFTPISREKMTKLFQADTLEIEELEELENDPDYLEKMANNKLGFYMENFVSYYGVCPVCRENTLRKYFHSNVPVVDFVCINSDYHLKTNTCFLFQLKISLGDEYFSFNQRTISIGSRRYGEIPHTVKGSDNIYYKRVVPGYICLKLIDQGMQNYRIDTHNSFVLIPDYNNKMNQSYYKYLPHKGKYNNSIITWNPSMFTTPIIEHILDTLQVTHEFFTEILIENPYSNI